MADFSFGEANRNCILFGNYFFNLEFQYDDYLGRMNYTGLYIRLLDNDNAYRMNILIEFFDASHLHYKQIYEPLKKKNLIDLRIHLELINSHFLHILKNNDISWEKKSLSYRLKTFGASGLTP